MVGLCEVNSNVGIEFQYPCSSRFSADSKNGLDMMDIGLKGDSQLLDLPIQFLIQRSTELLTNPPCMNNITRSLSLRISSRMYSILVFIASLPIMPLSQQ